MSATYFRVVKEGTVDYDSCLLYAGRSLGVSRAPVLGEGNDDTALLAQSQWIDLRQPSLGISQLNKTTGKQRLNLLLLLGAYYAFQPQGHDRMDSVEYFLNRAILESKTLKEERSKRQALCLLGKTYFDINEPGKGDSLFALLVNECRQSGDKQTEAKALEYWGMFPPFSPATIADRVERFLKAAAIHKDLKNTESEINATMNSGYLLVPMQQLQQAHEMFLKAHQLADQIGYPYIHYITDALTMVTQFGGKFGEPFKYAIQTINVAEAVKDSIGWPYFYHRLGMFYQTEGQREEESLKWYLKALDRFVRSGDASLSIDLFSTAVMLNQLGRPQEAIDLVSDITKKVPAVFPQDQIQYGLTFNICYMGLGKFKVAEQYLKEVEEILNKSAVLRRAYLQSLVNLQYGQTYFHDGQYERSKHYLEQYLSDPSYSRVLTNEISAYEFLLKIDSIYGDATTAVNRYRQYTKLVDSNFRVSKLRQAEELQVMYETEEKESQIVLLSEQAKLRQANLKQATFVRNVTIGGIVATLVIAGLLYRQNRIRQKSNVLITQKNDQLQRLLSEKEWLLKEIHHRVKNNLQVVMSLLNSQTAYIDNEPALTAIHDSQHRVHAMSLIHQKLYSSDNVSTIDMSLYIRELVAYLADSYNTGQRVHLIFDIEPVKMDVGQAVPLGLILNEAITNALKYAFPGERRGVINIMLRQVEHAGAGRTEAGRSSYELIVSDNGVGMPPGFNLERTSSLGMSLMRGLSEDIDGVFSLETGAGTTIKIAFQQEEIITRTRDEKESAYS